MKPNKKCTYTKDIKQIPLQHFLPHEVLVSDFRIPLLDIAISFSIFTVQNHIYSKMYNIVDSGLCNLHMIITLVPWLSRMLWKFQ